MPIEWHVENYQKISSTQDLAHIAANEGKPQGTVIQALMQDAGRGRHGNKWNAPVGNLYMSFLLRPDYDLNKAGQVSFIAACALARTLEDYLDDKKHTLKLKWPNDVLIDGLKVSGILLESNLQDNTLNSLIVGIGVNIFNKPDLAICLNDVSKHPVYVNRIRDEILHEFNVFYTLWQTKGFDAIKNFWEERAYGINQEMTARLPNTQHQGIFKGINKDGSLILSEKDTSTERIIHAGEVHFEEYK